MNIRILVALSVILIFSNSCQNSHAIAQNSTLDSQGNYANPSLGIAFQAPPGWTVQEPKKYQSDAPDVALIAPYSNGFIASISVSVEKANGTLLGDYVKKENNLLLGTNNTGGIKFVSTEDGTVGGLAAKISQIEENFSSQGSNNVVKFKQAIVLADDKFYTISFADEKREFDSNLPAYDQMLSTVKFTGEDSVNLEYLSIGIIASVLAVAATVAIRKKKRH